MNKGIHSIAAGLQKTAQGALYDGNSLALARDIQGLNDNDIAILNGWLTGSSALNPFNSRMRLQDIVIKIRGLNK